MKINAACSVTVFPLNTGFSMIRDFKLEKAHGKEQHIQQFKFSDGRETETLVPRYYCIHKYFSIKFFVQSDPLFLNYSEDTFEQYFFSFFQHFFPPYLFGYAIIELLQ